MPFPVRRPAALYIHIPFCAKHCPYCDFAVSTKRHQFEQQYLQALATEANTRLDANFQPRTIFIGGGTPTELSLAGLESLTKILAKHRQKVQEFTIEGNPGTLTNKKLQALLELGVTRISLGAQSSSKQTLDTLGRFHTPEHIVDTVARLRANDFHNINLDLIFGVPGQSVADLNRDLDQYLELAPPHISAYGLTYEASTPFFEQREQGLLKPVSESAEAHMFALIRKRLAEHDYIHYEISNYAKAGKACAHNRVYWRNGSYIGLGNSAVSHLQGRRLLNAKNLDQYLALIQKTGTAVVDEECLSFERKVAESAYLALRTSRGLDSRVFKRDLGVDILDWFAKPIANFLELGFLEEHEGAIRLSSRGLPVADTLAVEFL